MSKPQPTRSASVGEFVIYTDQHGVRHNALVTANWGGVDNPMSSVNVLYVSPDAAERDQYGQQIKRETSVVPGFVQTAHGRFYELLG